MPRARKGADDMKRTSPRRPASLAVVAFLSALLPETSSAQFAEPDASATRVLHGQQNGDFFGWVAATIGDLDDDGVEELIIPAIGHNTFSGRATVFSGADGAVLNDVLGDLGQVLGFAVGAAGDVNADGVPDYIVGGGRVVVFSGATHEVLLELTAITGFGHGVGTAGDVNQDGHDDLIVGSARTDTATTSTGRVYVISGATGKVLWTRDGETAGTLLGSAVGRVGDVNRDHIDDVVVGASGAGPRRGGEAYVLSGVDGALIHRLEPKDPATARTFGRFFASGAGDVDRDGVGDVFVGDFGAANDGVEGVGQAYIFSGRTGRRLHVLTGRGPEGFGAGRGIPDVNGDGHADILVAAWTNSDAAPKAGKLYLFSGRSGALLRTVTAKRPGHNSGIDAIWTGDIDGDGLPELLSTAVGFGFTGLDAGRAFVIAGTRLPCPADLTGDGRVGFRDLRALLRRLWHGGDGDLNGDTVTDRRDLRIFLKDWGRCPPGRPPEGQRRP